MKRLIKSDEMRAEVVEPRPLDLPDVAAEARQILADASAEASSLLDQARRQAASLQREAGRRGFEEGLVRGRAEGVSQGRRQAQLQAGQKLSADLAELTELAQKVVEALAAARGQLLQEARAEMLDFAVELASKIVGRAAETDIEAARENLRKVLELAGAGDDVTILVNPAQLEMLCVQASELVAALRFRGKVKLTGDERIGKGGVRLLGKGGEIDATIQTQLANVVEALRGPAARGEYLQTPAAKDAERV